MCGCMAKVCQDKNCISGLHMLLFSCNYRSEWIRLENRWLREWPSRRQPKRKASQIPQQWSKNLWRTSWTIQQSNVISTRIKTKYVRGSYNMFDSDRVELKKSSWSKMPWNVFFSPINIYRAIRHFMLEFSSIHRCITHRSLCNVKLSQVLKKW